MMKSPLMRTLMDAAILLTAVCAINQGLMTLGYDLMSSFSGIATYANYVFGAAGVYSLVMFFMGCCAHEGSCCK